MGESVVIIDETQVESCVMFCALVANPSTGNSAGLKMFKKSIREIETFDQIPLEETKLINCNMKILYFFNFFK
jgi:hypothetical protein